MDGEAYELELLNRAVAGDRVALTLLLTATRARLCERVRHRVPSDVRGGLEADDIVQETHVEVFRHIKDFDPQGLDAFFRWSATIAMRKLRDAIKFRRAIKRGGDVRSLPTGAPIGDSAVALLDLMARTDHTPSRSAAGHEIVDAVRSAMSSLPNDYRQVVGLVYLQGLTPAEAAAAMGRTERAIHNLCHKAKRHLKGLLGDGARFLSNS